MSLLGRPSRNRLVKETRCTKRIPTPSPLPYLRMGRGPHLQRSWALRFPSLSVATTKLEGLWVWPGLYCVDGITVQAARGPLIWNIDLRGRERRVDADIDCSQVLHEADIDGLSPYRLSGGAAGRRIAEFECSAVAARL